MAAPTTSYKTQKLIIPKGNSTGGVAIQKDLYIAKFLENTIPTSSEIWGDGYFNSTDTEAQKVAKIKDIFKIDGFLLVAKGAVDGSASETGFIGYCNSKTTGNGAFHKTERFSGVKISTTTNTEAELLNDGSLNVKGTIVVGNGTYITPDLANNGFTLTSTFKSSYYNITSSYGINWRKQGDTVYNTKILGTMDKKEKASFVTQTIDVDPSDILYVEAPNTYEIQGFITNEEGTTVVQMLNVTMTPVLMQFAYGTTLENAYLYGTNVNYYRNRRLTEGGILYSNSSGTIPVTAGFYMDKSGSAPFYYIECDSNGTILGFGEYDPTIARILYKPSGWGYSINDAINDANSTGWTPRYSIYFDPKDNKWYADNIGINLAYDGYWLIGDNEYSYEEIQLVNGIQQY